MPKQAKKKRAQEGDESSKNTLEDFLSRSSARAKYFMRSFFFVVTVACWWLSRRDEGDLIKAIIKWEMKRELKRWDCEEISQRQAHKMIH